MSIFALLASYQHFAELASDVQNSELFTILIQIAAYVTPYFLIPATFKFGLGVFGNLAGMINDRSRGLFDRQRKFRQGSRANMRQRAREGKRFQGGTDTNLRGRFNRGISGGMNAPGAILESGNLTQPRNWAAATRARSNYVAAQAIERNMKENAAYLPWKHNDELNRAAAESNNAQQLRENLVNNYGYVAGSRQLEDDVARVETVRRSMGNDAFRQMTTLQAIAGGTTYQTAGEISHAIARAAGNDSSAAAWLVAQGRSASMSAGRVDYGGAGFGAAFGEVTQFRDMIADGASQTDIEAEMIRSTDRLTSNVYQSQGGATLVHSSMKPNAVRQMAPAVVRTVEASGAGHDEVRFAQDLASIAATYDGMAASSPEKARIWADAVMSHDIDVSQLSQEARGKLGIMGPVQQGATVTVRDAIEQLRGDENFLEMRREFNTAIAAQQGGMQPTPPGQGPIQPPGQLGNPSDVRLKENIQYLQTTKEGIKIYRFNYFWDDQTYVGVMAQDLLETHPQVLNTDEFGFYTVEYTLLGLRMQTYEQWLQNPSNIYRLVQSK